MAQKLRCALLQVDLFWEDIPANLRMLGEEIDRLPSEVDLIVLPEMFTTGFTMNAPAMAEPHPGHSLKWMQEVASNKQVAITGSIIVEQDRKYFNRLYFVYPDKSFRHYDKRHTFTFAGEHKTFTRGSEKLILMYKGWKICPLVCYDLRFPVWARNTEDYDLLIYIANWPEPRVNAWDTLLSARAIENMSYCIGVNRVGTDGNDLPYCGHSNIYDPYGRPLLNAREDVFAEILTLDFEEQQEARSKMKFLQDRDRFQIL